MELISQIIIFICGGLSVFLVARLDKWKRFGYIFGLLSQPFWFYTTIKHQQYGITILSLWYTYNWSVGIYNYWIKER